MKKNKDRELGEKARAGTLLSSFIRTIAQEKIAIEVEGRPPEVIMKAEALARQIWNRALGEYRTVDSKTGKITHYCPDKDMIHLIFDRMEGKAGSAEDAKNKIESIPEKMSRQNKERLNKLGFGEG